jgi:uncharacterized protein YhaN
MRFATLRLDRYGHFTGKQLDLSGAEVRLHIVHGRNESGKSTLLAAIGDLLFGFPARTSFDFLHDYKSLEIGATIVSGTGDTLSFKRRKGNARTLRTDADLVLPDGTLAAFLGDADRALFEGMFGLDHERLRAGGKRMMEAEGDLGRALFEAGSGLDGVDLVRDWLQDELDALGTPERKSARKPLWQATEDFSAAQKAKRALALRDQEFHAAEKALADAVAAKADLNQELAAIRARRSRLERIRRVGPLVIDIDRLSSEAAALADVPALPEGFEAHRLGCEQALLAASTAVESARTAHEALARELDAIPAGETLTRFATEIGSLQTRLGEYLKGIADEPKLARDIARFNDEIGRHLASLGLALGPDEAEDRIPRTPLVKKIRDAIRDGDKLRTKLDRSTEERSRAEQALGESEELLAGLDGIRDPAVARSMLEAVARQGDIGANLAKQRQEAAKAARELDEAMGRLEGWSTGVEALAATALPSIAAIRDHEQSRQKLELAMDATLRRLAEAGSELRDVEAAIETLAAAGELPTTEAVAAARDRRDAVWHLLRRRKLEGRDDTGTGPSAAQADADLVGRYETSVRQADELADRKAAEAQRIARFAELAGRRDRLSRQTAEDRAAVERLEQDLAALATAWHATWAAIGLKAGAPAAMAAFLAAKDEALRLLAAKRHADEELLLATETEARARDLLASAAKALGLAVTVEEGLADLDHRVRAATKAMETDWARRHAAEEASRRARRALQEKRTEAAALEAALEAWTGGWSTLVPELSCAADAGPDEAAAMLEIWDQMRDPVTKRAETARRLEGLRADTARFRADVLSLVAAIAAIAREQACEQGGVFGQDPCADPKAALQDLAPRLEQEKLRLAKREDVRRRREAARIGSERAEADLAAARTALEDLRRLHGLGETTDLAELGSRATAKRSIAEGLRKRREDLAREGDGFDEEALREQCRTVSPDALEAEVKSLMEREDELVLQGQAAAQAETCARQALETLRAKTGAADAEAKGRDAALAFAGHAERWLLLETARQLLLRAVERYRVANEHPMILRASELFARIAAAPQNPIVRLCVDYRDGRAPVIVGQRADGRSCDVAEMSEGTRDQLFLCLRIAAIEAYAKEHEPLPFIADDLFVTSDDARVVPGLAALADLGCTTQVLLFTHHRHVVDAASTLPDGTVRIHELS